MTGLAESEVFDLLDEALHNGVLTVADARYHFSHELARQALVEGVPPHRRTAVHRDVARRPAAARIAAHWTEGGRPREAVDWLLIASRQAVDLGAFGDALGLLESALTHARHDERILSLRADVLAALVEAPAAYALAAAGAGDEAATELRCRQALAQLKAGDPDGAVATLDGSRPRTLAGRISRALTLSGAAAVVEARNRWRPTPLASFPPVSEPTSRRSTTCPNSPSVSSTATSAPPSAFSTGLGPIRT